MFSLCDLKFPGTEFRKVPVSSLRGDLSAIFQLDVRSRQASRFLLQLQTGLWVLG